MTMDPQVAMAFDFAKDLSTQLITISTGILALSVTFAKDILKGIAHGKLRYLVLSWLLFLLAICFGILSLMALTGALAPPEATVLAVTGIPASARQFAGGQVIAFVLAVISLLSYGTSALRAMLAAGMGMESVITQPATLSGARQGPEPVERSPE